MKAHLKRLVAPKQWPLLRKSAVFVTRPLPSGHKQALSLPLTVILRDLLNVAQNTKEVRLMVLASQVLIDNKPAKNTRQAVGLMDTIHLPLAKKAYRLSLSKKGKLQLIEIAEKEVNTKICGIYKKKNIKGNKIQLQGHDGRTFLSDSPAKPGDSIVLSLPKQEFIQHLKLEKDAQVLMLKGRHIGHRGQVQAVEQHTITVKLDNEVFKTSMGAMLVIGKEKPAHKVMDDE